MEKKRTKATDIAEIAALLDGKVDFQQISFNQVLTTEHGKSINDLLFVSKKFGIWFYTSRSAFESDVRFARIAIFQPSTKIVLRFTALIAE